MCQCCILLKFYIKPQPDNDSSLKVIVVSYWNSTSNHNSGARRKKKSSVVSYWNSTSNHNYTVLRRFVEIVVSYWNSTSNHNLLASLFLSGDVVSYWNSTSNHNRVSEHVAHGLLYLIEILHQTTTISANGYPPSLLYLIEILHQTTTDRWWTLRSTLLYLIEILHQTTTSDAGNSHCQGCILLKFYIKPQRVPLISWLSNRCILLKFYIKPQLALVLLVLAVGCILLKFYIKPQRRGRHLLNFSALYRSSWSENRMRKHRRSEFDVLFSISKNENTVFLEKFQLLRHIRLRPFTFAPEVENVSILFVCHRQNTCKSCRRHWPSNAIDVNLHVLFRGTMPDVHRILHHREAVFLQRLAELCRMTPFGFGIGRQIEKDKQPHDPIGIQSCFWHGLIPTRDMILFSVCRRSILLWKRL